MCGLTGFLSLQTHKKRSELQAQGRAMAETLRHRGPDAGALWQDDDVALLLVHRRLSIIDLSEEGRQPMTSHSGRYVIVYNGEIYNFPELQRELEAAGVRFRGRSDTEIFLAGVEAWGLNRALQKINGMFAFALWDREKKILHCARDRMGKKPLYMGWAEGGTLLFGSELKALKAHADFKPVIAPGALELYLRYGHVPAPYTIYQGVWNLPPGHRIDLPLGTLMPGQNLEPLMQPYWHALSALQEARTHLSTRSDSETIDAFEDLLSICVKDRMLSDVPLGAFLSGGIDSSAVVALMQKHSARPVKTYTIGFEEAGFNEAAHARDIAAHLGTDHHELTLHGADALAMIPMLPEMYDEPFSDISAIPTYLVSRFARGDVTVALSGDGGDEMLGGYRRHIEAPRLWAMMRMIPQPLKAALSALLKTLPPEGWDKLIPGRPQIGSAVYKAAEALPLKTQSALYQKLTSSWAPVPMAGHKMNALSPFALRPEWQPPAHLELAEKMMYWDAISYLPGTILTKVDRASMAASLEARAPLLDKRIYEFVWTLPLSMKLRGGQGKWLLRQVLARHVPKAFFERPKQGFSIPVAAWLRGPLKDWAEDLLSPASLNESGLLDPAPIRASWEKHKQGSGGQAEKLWTVLMFQAWLRRWA